MNNKYTSPRNLLVVVMVLLLVLPLPVSICLLAAWWALSERSENRGYEHSSEDQSVASA